MVVVAVRAPAPKSGRVRWSPTDTSSRLAAGALFLPLLTPPAALLGEAAHRGGGAVKPLIPVVALGSLACLTAIVLLSRAGRTGDPGERAARWGITLVALLLVGEHAAVPTAPVSAAGPDLLWWYLFAAVAVWAASRGPVAGGIAAVAAVGVEAGRPFLLTGRSAVDPVPLLFDHTVHLLLGTAAILLARHLVLRGAELAHLEGQRHGRVAERQQLRRSLHDTVLQTLEAIALPREGGQPGAAQLADVRRVARRQAMELRQLLGGSGDPPVDGAVLPALQRLAADFTGRGLIVELTQVGAADVVLEHGRADAVEGAVRECLTNVLKHSGAPRAVVLALVTQGRLVVSVRDHGCGFDPGAASAGFGLRESIRRRTEEMGGDVAVRSEPGRGTQVTLRFPVPGRARSRGGSPALSRVGAAVRSRVGPPVGFERTAPAGAAGGAR